MQKRLTARDFDDVGNEASYWLQNAWWMTPAAVFVVTAALTVLMFPPAEMMAFAYLFAAPLCFWALRRPAFKIYAIVVFGAQAVAWTIILSWLHHVTWAGLLLLGPFTGAWVGLWYLAVWRAARDYVGRPFVVRIAVMLGLAALWVIIEWTRTWMLGGFPWLPLGASQCRMIVLLQIASFTGQWGISFVVIMVNFAFAAYVHRLFFEKHTGLRRRSPEFSVASFVVVLAMFPFFANVLWERDNPENIEPFARFALVQPAIPQEIKWSRENFDLSFTTLRKLSMEAVREAPEIIVWPEAALPYAVHGWPESERLRAWMREVAVETKTPLLTGAITQPDKAYHNAAFVVDPDPENGGVQPRGYHKRRLVPFGEYVPLRPVLGWLNKVTDASQEDAQAGDSALPLHVRTPRAVISAGMLICYEDIFPSLALHNVAAGADVLVVVTNNGWFGEGGAAYQHAAHSVLRAVEMRRPVIRCGNSGWSGWIDEHGYVRMMSRRGDGAPARDAKARDAGRAKYSRGVMPADRDETIYFQGTQTFAVTRDKRWAGQQSFYARHGDWFVAVCGVLVLFGHAMSRHYFPHDKTPPVYAETVAG